MWLEAGHYQTAVFAMEMQGGMVQYQGGDLFPEQRLRGEANLKPGNGNYRRAAVMHFDVAFYEIRGDSAHAGPAERERSFGKHRGQHHPVDQKWESQKPDHSDDDRHIHGL